MAKSRLKGQSIKALSQLQKEFCYFEFDNQIRVGRISEINQVRNGTRDEDINMYPLSPSKLLMRRHLETLPLAFNADEGTMPSPYEETSTPSGNILEKETSSSDDNEEFEPMFGFGMFDEPSPDTTEILERDRQRLESVERRMESLSEREELMEVSAYDASRAATKLEEHISAFNSILVKAQEIAAEDKLKELEAAEEARQKEEEEMQLDLEDPDIEMVAERFHESLARLVAARDDLSKIEKHLARILKMERDEQLEKLTEMTESYESTKRKIDALESSKEARDAAAVENNIMNMLSAAASGGSMADADFGDFGDLGGDDEYEVEIYEDEDGSFYYIDPDTGEEVPCDQDGNAL